MILSRPETAKAFELLIAQLDEEVRELREIGSKVAFQGVASKATGVLKLAAARAQFRDHIHLLYQKWQQVEPTGLSAITAPPPDPPEVPAPLTPDIQGPLLSIGEATRKVGVSQKQIREWIFAGHLPAKQGPTGKWRVSGPGLIECFRKHSV